MNQNLKQQNAGRKGILVISFGTSHADACKACIESVENKISQAFPEYEIRRAFTSGIIINKLKERDNIIIDNPEEALNKMKQEGFAEIIVQPLHIIPGSEYNDLKTIVDKFKGNYFAKIASGNPILYHIEDYKIALEALKTQLPELIEGQAIVLMGHGTQHYANASYACLQSIIDDQGLNIFVGTVEGYPELSDLIPKLKRRGINEVTLMPYMLVAGDHTQNDMAGDEEDSWKSILKNEGFAVNVWLHGLGENPAYQDIYLQHIKNAIEENREEDL